MPPDQNSDIPEDVLRDILSRLSTKALGLLKCASKQWRNLISDSYFVQEHLETFKHNENLIIVIHSRFLSTLKIDEVFEKVSCFAKVVFDPDIMNPRRQIKVMGSCNGLLLIIDEMDFMFLVKPTTREAKKMMDLRVGWELCYSGYGLGYDPSNNNYMVIAVFYVAGFSDNFVFRFTLKTDSWKRIEGSTYKHVTRSRFSGCLVNGNLHWLASYKYSDAMVIAAFSSVDQRGSWVLYLSIDDPVNMLVCKPLCMMRGGEVVWDADGNTLFAYKPDECLCRYRNLLRKFVRGETCLETLQSPNYD